MNDQIEIKDLDQEIPLQEDWLVFQKDSNRIVYKAPKSDIEGEDAFVYIGYADDDIGTGFTLTFDSSKDYIAFKSTNVEIPNPQASDFAGLWKKYKGETGEKGDAATIQVGTVTTVDPGDPVTVVNSGDEHTAVFNFEIPQGEKGKGIVSIDKTGTVGLIDTYTITYNDGTTTTFDVTNGEQGDSGRGIVSIEKTNTVGLVDTYTITYTDSTTSTFDVINGASFTPKGAYNALTEYVANDVVSYLGSSWIALQTTTGNTPQEGAYWTLNASKGTDGEGSGDMLASVYDPKNVAGNAFDMDNMVEGTNNKLVSAAEKSGWSGKQDALGFTPEDVDNKKTAMTGNTTSDTFYLTAKAIYDWATGLFQTLANKVTSFQVTPDDAHYPSEKLVKDSLDAKMTSPMTTQGDIIYGGASGLPTRLPKGTAGQVLKMNNAETAPEWGTGSSSSAPYMFCPYASSSIAQADEEFNVIYSAAKEIKLTTITNNNLIKGYYYPSIWTNASSNYGIVIIGGYIYFLLNYSTPDPDQFKLFRMSLTDTAYTSVTEITFSGGTTLIDSNNSTTMSSDGTNLYFTYNAGNSSNRYILAKFSLSGTTATYVSSITLSDSPTSFNNYSVDSSGNIYTVTSSVVKKYNSSGTLQITSEQPIGDANNLLNFKGTMYWYSPYKGCYYKLMG